MSEQQRGLQINTDLPEPTSPKRQTSGQNTGNVLLSPKADGAIKLLSQQSPSVMKNKLDVLRKLYEKTLQNKNALGDIDASINQKRQQLDGFKTLLEAKLNQGKNNQQAQKRLAQNRATLHDLQNRLQNLRSDKSTQVGSQKISHLKSQISNAEQQIQIRQRQAQQSRNNQINKQVQKKKEQLNQIVRNLQYKKNLTQNALNVTRNKVNEGKSELQSLLGKLLSFASNTASHNLINELDTKQKSLQQQIYNRKQENQALRTQLQLLQKQQVQSTGENPQTVRLNKVKAEVEQSKRNVLQVQKSLDQAKKQSSDLANKIKNNQKNIQKQKTKHNDLNAKTKKLQQQKADLQQKVGEGPKKQKYQQKIPQELIVIRKRKQQLTADIKHEVQKTQKQRNQANNLVPPTVLQNFKNRIARIHEKNQRHGKLVIENAALVEENKKLDANKEQLEWEINPDLKNNQANRQKQQSKCHALEQEVAELRKKNVQVATKLEQYAKQYPDFKPEKKIKKQEPVPQQPTKKQSKQQTVQQDDKNNKKKKNNKQQSNSAQQVPQSKVQEQKPTQVQAPSNKNKKGGNKKQQTKSASNIKEKSPSPQVKPEKLQFKKDEPTVLQRNVSAEPSPTLKLQSKKTVQQRQQKDQQAKKNKKKK